MKSFFLPLNLLMRWQVMVSNSPTVLSVDAVTNLFPSGVNCRSTMAPEWEGLKI